MSLDGGVESQIFIRHNPVDIAEYGQWVINETRQYHNIGLKLPLPSVLAVVPIGISVIGGGAPGPAIQQMAKARGWADLIPVNPCKTVAAKCLSANKRRSGARPVTPCSEWAVTSLIWNA